MRSTLTPGAAKAVGGWVANGRPGHDFQSAEGPYCDVCAGAQDGIQHPLDSSVLATERYLIQRRIPSIPSRSEWDTYDEAAGQVGAERRLSVHRRTFDARVKWRLVKATTTYVVIEQDEEVQDADTQRPTEAG